MQEGFTIGEIMIAVVIIGLLAALALPTFNRVRAKSQATAIANNLHQFERALEQYALEYGTWPVESSAGALPEGMTSANFPAAAWEAGLKQGGLYDWDFDIDSIKAGISIVHNASSNGDSVWAAVDKIIDDGNTTTGKFVLIAPDRFKYTVEP